VSTANALKALYPQPIGGKEIAVGNDFVLLADALVAIKAELKTCKGKEDELKNRILAMFGDAEVARMPDGRVATHKLQQRKGYTVEDTSFTVLRMPKPR